MHAGIKTRDTRKSGFKVDILGGIFDIERDMKYAARLYRPYYCRSDVRIYIKLNSSKHALELDMGGMVNIVDFQSCGTCPPRLRQVLGWKNTAIPPLDHNKNVRSCLEPRGAISQSDILDAIAPTHIICLPAILPSCSHLYLYDSSA